MSRSGYVDDCWDDNNWPMICYRGAVKSALRGKRGQSFLAEMVTAMDALPSQELGAHDLIDQSGCVCALGAVAWYRGMDLCEIDPENIEAVSASFGIAESMAREIVFENDDEWGCSIESPRNRFHRMRRWVSSWIAPTNAGGGGE